MVKALEDGHLRRVCLPVLNSASLASFFPGGASVKESTCQCRRHKRTRIFIPGSGRSPWSRKWQHTLVYLPGKSHEQRNLADYSPWAAKSQIHTQTERVRARARAHTHRQTHRASFSASSWFSLSLLLRSSPEKSSYIYWL